MRRPEAKRHCAYDEEVPDENAAGRVIKLREYHGGAAERSDGGDGECGDKIGGNGLRLRSLRRTRRGRLEADEGQVV